MITYDKSSMTAHAGCLEFLISFCIISVLSILINLTDMDILQIDFGNFSYGIFYRWLSFMEYGKFHFGGLILSIWTCIWSSITLVYIVLVLIVMCNFYINKTKGKKGCHQLQRKKR